MPRKVSPNEKCQAVKAYLDGLGSMQTLATKYGVHRSTFRKWLTKYQTFGETAFLRTGHNASYRTVFKRQVVDAYLAGEGSLRELAITYKIPTVDTIRRWVLKYNGHEKLRTGGKPLMTMGRKTTFHERIEIVHYCIAHEHNYTKTAQQYQVSYQQVRTYTIKYETKGIEGLQDRRGKRKAEAEINELDKLRAENKILRAEKEQAEMEASFLKKLEEIERRWD